MQYLTAIAIIFIALSFAAIVIVDFISGLVDIWEKAGTLAQARVNTLAVINQLPADPKLETELTPSRRMLQALEQAIPLPSDLQSVKSQLLLAPAGVQVATLQWASSNLPPIEIFIVEMPDAIAMAKSKLSSSTPAVQLATRQQLIDSGIRRCKKLASKLKIRRYNVMKLSELADNLQGLVATSDLISDSELLV